MLALSVSTLLSVAQASPATVVARRVTDDSDLLEGPGAQGQVGDFLLRNEEIAVIVEDVGHPHGDGLSGGNVLDAAAGPSWSDRLGHVLTILVDHPRQAVYDLVEIESDGTGGEAVVRASGADSANDSLQVVTRYILRPNDRFIEIETTVTNAGSAVEGYRAGDAFDWAYGDNFAPGYGFELAGLTTFGEWVGSASLSTSYGYSKHSGTVQAVHGQGWSDAWPFSGTVPGGGSISFSRCLAAGSTGLSSASDVVHAIHGTPTGLLTGSVSDDISGDPIAEATVDCLLNGTIPYTQAVTVPGGGYVATLPPGSYGLEFSAEAYTDLETSAAVAAAGTTVVDVDLYPIDSPLARGDTLTVIMRPILTVPEIVIDGESFVIEAMAPPLTTDWRASIARGSAAHDLPVSGSVYHSDHERWFLNVSVPEGVASEIYDLIVEASGGIADTAAHAVAVRDTIGTSFYFAHVTDTHLPTHLFYGDDGWDADTTEMDDFREVIDDINLANPAFVLVTGDLVNEGETEEFLGHRAFTKAQRLLERLDVPVFVVAGNHDVGGWESTPPPDGTARREWWRFFGWRYLAAPPPGDDIYTQNYSFDYGGAHFVGLEAYLNYDNWRLPIYGWDSFTDRQLEWLLNDLSLVDPASPTILFYHYDFDDDLTDLASLGVDCALWGHRHSNWGSIYAHPLNLATNNVCDGERWMRFLRVEDGVISASEPITAGEDGDRLRASFDVANDGTSARITATVSNENYEAFERALLRFRVPADSLPYAVSTGEITQTLVEGDVAICYVEFNIPFQNTTVVAIEPTGEIPHLPEGSIATLRQSHPNPTRGGTTIEFVLAFAADVTLDVFDVAGRRVRRLLNGPIDAGECEATWDLTNESGEKVAPGVYFYRLVADDESATRKLAVIE